MTKSVCYFLYFVLLFVLSSCDHQIIYKIDKLDDNTIIRLKDWNIVGIKKANKQSSRIGLLDENLLSSAGITDSIFSISPYQKAKSLSEKEIEGLLFNSMLKSDDPVIDKNAIEMVKYEYGVEQVVMYYYCQIESKKNDSIYFLSRSSGGTKIWLNSEVVFFDSNLHRDLDYTFTEFVPLLLKEGINYLVVKKVNVTYDVLFEGILCRKNKMLESYHKTAANKFFYPSILTNDTLYLDRDYVAFFNDTVKLEVKNIKNTYTESCVLKESGSFLYLPDLEKDCSYLLSFRIDNFQFSQPLYKGNPDLAYKRFVRLKNEISNNEVLNLINPLLYRLNALLNLNLRDDYWWVSKVANIIYELDNIYINYNDRELCISNTFGIHLKSYISNLDNTDQHYLLITPDNMNLHEKYPLVVVIKPVNENHHHFLTSPQIARLWSLLRAKYLANKYGYIIIMPNGRLFQNEELIPMAESEILYAIEDVRQFCNIDDNKIYLHGNCSAGYRCLSLAVRHPDLFAAIGLYAPVYHTFSQNSWVLDNSPEKNMRTLREIPIFIHYDPFDRHAPYSSFKKIIEDCQKENIKLTMSTGEYSGIHYNVFLVGEETFDFFQGKTRSDNSVSKLNEEQKKHNKIIADFYSQPFVFVYNELNKSQHYKNVVDSIKNEYEKYLFSEMPLVESRMVTKDDLIGKNIFFIGHEFDNEDIMNLLSMLPLTINNEFVEIDGERYEKGKFLFQVILDNPFDMKKSIVVYSTNYPAKFSHKICFPWKKSLEKSIVYK